MAPTEHSQSPRRARPQSTIAQNFSAALDEMFKLNGLGALELSVEEKKDEVHVQKLQLDDLESKLRETTARLARLEARHQRNQSQNMLGGRRPSAVRPVIEEHEETTDDSGGDSRSEGESGQRLSR